MGKRAILTYTVLAALALLSACGAGGAPPGGGSSTAPIVVNISPQAVQVQIGTQRQFTGTIQGGGSNPGNVSWSIVSGPGNYGSIDSAGLYTAPPTMPAPNTLVIRATSTADPSKFADANVSLTAGQVWGAFPVLFDVKTRDGWQALQAPVTVGIPLPSGLLLDENTLRIQTQAGADVPAQFQVTSRWPGGSIRWVLCDFIADLTGVGGVGKYRLNIGGTGNATGTSLTVVNGASDVAVNTGTLRFSVNKTSFKLLNSVMIDRDNDTQVDDECLNTAAMKGVVITDGVTEYLSGNSAPTRVAVEQSGPIRATIVVEGEHRDNLSNRKLSYVCRLTAWNGQSHVKVQYSLKNMDGHNVATATPAAAMAQMNSYQVMDSIHLDLPMDFAGMNPSAAISGTSTTHVASGLTGGEFLNLLQNYTGTHDATDTQNPQPAGSADGSSDTLTNNWPTQGDGLVTYNVTGKSTGSGGHAPGWMMVAVGNLRTIVAMRDFWQQYPKSLRAEASGLCRVGIWPSGTWQAQFFAGSMKTHDMLLSFDRSAALTTSVAEARFNIINDPPVGICAPRHYQASSVFGEIGTTNETLTDTTGITASAAPFAMAYMSELITHFGDILVDRNDGNGAALGHEYGFWNFGDGKTDAPDLGFENNQWGVTKAALQWFAASGNLNLFRFAEDSARHFRDVDVLHANIGLRFDYTESGNPAVSGGKASQQGKTRYAPNNKQHDLGHYNGGANHLDVFNGAFLAEHYLLTGDTLSLDILRECFTYLRGTWKRFFDAGNGGVDSTLTAPSTWISNALHLAAAYQHANGINDTAAATMCAYVLQVVNTRQSAVKPNDPNGRGFGDNTGSFRAWQVGHMVEALEYTRWIREDTAIDTNILDCMNWLLGSNANVYLGNLAVPQFGAFAEMPGGTTDFGGPNLMIGAGYVGAYRASSSVNWRTAAENLLDVQTGNIDAATLGDDGIRHSTFAQFFRAGPLLLGTVRQ